MNGSLSAERRRKTILSVVLALICILYILPVLAVVVNSFKLNTYVKTETFADRKSTRLNSSHWNKSRMPSSA